MTALVSGARPRSFVAQFDNQYAWSAVPWVVSFSIVSFAASFAILRYIGRVWLLQCLVISLAIGSIAMITGYSFSAYEPQAPASGLCGAADQEEALWAELKVGGPSLRRAHLSESPHPASCFLHSRPHTHTLHLSV